MAKYFGPIFFQLYGERGCYILQCGYDFIQAGVVHMTYDGIRNNLAHKDIDDAIANCKKCRGGIIEPTYFDW